MRSAINRGPHTTLRVCFYDETAQIRNRPIDLIRLRFPPGADFRVEWVGGLESANLHRRGEAGSEKDAHAPRPKDIRPAVLVPGSDR